MLLTFKNFLNVSFHAVPIGFIANINVNRVQHLLYGLIKITFLEVQRFHQEINLANLTNSLNYKSARFPNS